MDRRRYSSYISALTQKHRVIQAFYGGDAWAALRRETKTRANHLGNICIYVTVKKDGTNASVMEREVNETMNRYITERIKDKNGKLLMTRIESIEI